MKTHVLGSLIALSTATALAQGTVNFANIQGSLNVPIYGSDGTTKLSGARFLAELMAGTSPNNINMSVAITGFLTGGGAGYFSAGGKTITGIAGGATAWLQVRFWDTAKGATFAEAQTRFLGAWGESIPFSVTLGDPSAIPPTLPAALSGLAGQTLWLSDYVIPEPAAPALLGCGLVVMLSRRGLTRRGTE
jgi:hypothetical protein